MSLWNYMPSGVWPLANPKTIWCVIPHFVVLLFCNVLQINKIAVISYYVPRLFIECFLINFSSSPNLFGSLIIISLLSYDWFMCRCLFIGINICNVYQVNVFVWCTLSLCHWWSVINLRILIFELILSLGFVTYL